MYSFYNRPDLMMRQANEKNCQFRSEKEIHRLCFREHAAIRIVLLQHINCAQYVNVVYA